MYLILFSFYADFIYMDLLFPFPTTTKKYHSKRLKVALLKSNVNLVNHFLNAIYSNHKNNIILNLGTN